MNGINDLKNPMSSSSLKTLAQPQKPEGAPQAPADGFSKSDDVQQGVNWKNLAKLGAGTVIGGGLGVASGLFTGPLAAVAGGLAGFSGGAVAGLLIGAYLGDKFGGGDSPKVAGIAIWSTLAGMGIGLATGVLVGAMVSNPLAAVAMGALGALGGFGRSLLHLASQQPKPEQGQPKP